MQDFKIGVLIGLILNLSLLGFVNARGAQPCANAIPLIFEQQGLPAQTDCADDYLLFTKSEWLELFGNQGNGFIDSYGMASSILPSTGATISLRTDVGNLPVSLKCYGVVNSDPATAFQAGTITAEQFTSYTSTVASSGIALGELRVGNANVPLYLYFVRAVGQVAVRWSLVQRMPVALAESLRNPPQPPFGELALAPAQCVLDCDGDLVPETVDDTGQTCASMNDAYIDMLQCKNTQWVRLLICLGVFAMVISVTAVTCGTLTGGLCLGAIFATLGNVAVCGDIAASYLTCESNYVIALENLTRHFCTHGAP